MIIFIYIKPENSTKNNKNIIIITDETQDTKQCNAVSSATTLNRKPIKTLL